MILKVENAAKTFSQGDSQIQVFKDLNLALDEGQSLAILGTSGSGKTTLLSLIAGLDRPTAGRVVVDDTDLSQLDEAELTHFRAAKLGIIFQQYHLFRHLTALENVAMPLEIAGVENADEKAREALKRVGLGHRLTHYPHQLSGGENQRVAFARAMVIKPRLLLADEPSGSLDSQTGENIMKLLFDLVRQDKMTLVLVTHNEELAQKCDRQFRFN